MYGFAASMPVLLLLMVIVRAKCRMLDVNLVLCSDCGEDDADDDDECEPSLAYTILTSVGVMSRSSNDARHRASLVRYLLLLLLLLLLLVLLLLLWC
jgi:hypothetical protein